jgi:spermidine synthase
VAIFSSGAGAALREVLKYSAIEEVVVVALDAEVVAQSREHLPTLSNCSWAAETDSNVKNYNDAVFMSCFADPRTSLVSSTASDWLHTHFGGDACASDAATFDVIIIDLLDPEISEKSGFVQASAYTAEFFKQVACALGPDGVLVTQLGQAPSAAELTSDMVSKAASLQLLSQVFTSGVQVYNTFVPSFGGEWSLAVGCKSRACANRWYQNTAAVDQTLRTRLDHRSQAPGEHKFGQLQFFDGATMQGMNTLPRGWENLFCTPKFRTAGEALPAACIAMADRSTAMKSTPVVGNGFESAPAPAPTDLGSAVTSSRAAVLEMISLAEKSENADSHKQMIAWIMRYGYSCTPAEGREAQIFVAAGDMSTPGCATPRHAAVDANAGLKTSSWNPVVRRHVEEMCNPSQGTGYGFYLGDATSSAWGTYWGKDISAVLPYLPAECAPTPTQKKRKFNVNYHLK